MPFIVRRREARETAPGLHVRPILTGTDTADGRILVEARTLAAGASSALTVPQGGLGWVQVLRGAGMLEGAALAEGAIALLPSGFSGAVTASDGLELVLSVVPDAARFDAGLAERPVSFRVFDWTREPLLQSEHDGRKRVYIASEGLFGTSAVKGEVIVYPPGATCPEHHHEGAEHYQYVMSGSGIAVLEGEEHRLDAGDLLYNLENERHWFYNPGETDFVFVELFVPGACRTVWAPQASVCTWAPTGSDLAGREPVRQIGRHVHGDGTLV